jgi:protoporphyrinogen oxidase
VFPDNWLYIHDAHVNVGRIQNYKNWSPDMVPDASKTCLGLEYFCGPGDGLQSMTDEQLIGLATAELGEIGVVDPARVVDGAVVRAPKAYPIYDADYLLAVRTVRGHLARFDNLQTIGRNGTHTYNNQDHSMVMGMLAARNLFGEHHDLSAVNAADEYLEDAPEETSVRQWAGLASTQPRIPLALRTQPDQGPPVSATS